MNHKAIAMLTEELCGLIERLIDKQVALRAVVGQKLEAMRRCDVDGMLRTSRQEGDLVGEVSGLERRRREVVSQMCVPLGTPVGRDGRSVTLRALVGKLGPRAGRLAELADRLREEMLRLAEANRVVDLVCREMQAHFTALFAAMVQAENDAPMYSSDGEIGPAMGARVLDAMG
jgi:hypothetical protein